MDPTGHSCEEIPEGSYARQQCEKSQQAQLASQVQPAPQQSERREGVVQIPVAEVNHDDAGDKLCELIPVLCSNGKWNPLNYDTVGIGLRGLLKAVLGVDGDITIYFNMAALRKLEFGNVDVSINLEPTVSAGPSIEVAGGLTITGKNGNVLDQSTVDIIGLDGLSGHLGGCIPDLAACISIDASTRDGLTMDSISYFVGVGEGFDASLDIVAISDWVLYSNANDLQFQWPVIHWLFE